MRESLTPWAADDIDQLRYQLRQSQIAGVKAASVVRVLNRHRDVPACKGCGYQRCNCPPELVEEVGPVWQRLGLGHHQLLTQENGRRVGDVGWDGLNQSWRATSFDKSIQVTGERWFTLESQAREWVEEQHAEAVEEAKPAGEWRSEVSFSGRAIERFYANGKKTRAGYVCSSRLRPGMFLACNGGQRRHLDTEAEARAWVEERVMRTADYSPRL